jgi:hypothetical protein
MLYGVSAIECGVAQLHGGGGRGLQQLRRAVSTCWPKLGGVVWGACALEGGVAQLHNLGRRGVQQQQHAVRFIC